MTTTRKPSPRETKGPGVVPSLPESPAELRVFANKQRDRLHLLVLDNEAAYRQIAKLRRKEADYKVRLRALNQGRLDPTIQASLKEQAECMEDLKKRNKALAAENNRLRTALGKFAETKRFAEGAKVTPRVPTCKCELRNRLWNPNTERCERCGRLYV